MTSLDPRSPLVLDTVELGRRPGSMRRLQRTVQVAHDLGTEVIGVKAGTDIELDVRLESVMEGVLVSGTAHARATGECVRCLDDIEHQVEVTFQELYVYPEKKRRDGRPHQGEGDEAEADEYELQDDLVELELVITHAVVPSLPFQPVCREDCPGLCSQCGARLADEPEHAHDDIDPRWSALLDLRNDKES